MMTVKSIKKQIVPTLKSSGAIKVALFGSFATGIEKRNSDINVLVKFGKTISLLDLAAIKLKLEDKTDKKIDLLTYNSIHPLLKNIILNEQRVIYEKRSPNAIYRPHSHLHRPNAGFSRR